MSLLICQLILTLAVYIEAQVADEYYAARWSRCLYSSGNYSDMVYIDSYYFNKYMIVQFDSTSGRFVGSSEYGVSIAEAWNNNSIFLSEERAAVSAECRFYIEPGDYAVHDKVVKPKVKLSLVKQAGGRNPLVNRNPAVLMCSAYEFYPQYIKMSWLRDGEVVTSDVTSVMEMADGDWYYQIHSELAYFAKPGEKISCMVEHASFSKPIIYDWDPNLPWVERIQFIIGGCFLALGIIIVTSGLIYYKMKSVQFQRRTVMNTIGSIGSSSPRSASPLSIADTCNL